jgi:hypothetical protein
MRRPHSQVPGLKFIAAFAIDATVIDCLKPTDVLAAQALFSSKTGRHGWLVFFVTTLRGLIAYVSQPEGAAMHDKTHWNISGACNLLQAKYGESGKVVVGNTTYQLEMWADKAYPYMDLPRGWKARITRSGAASTDTDSTDKVPAKLNPKLENVVFDTQMARHRAVIERVNHCIKSFEAVTSMSDEKLNKMVRLCAAIHNVRLKLNPQLEI